MPFNVIVNNLIYAVVGVIIGLVFAFFSFKIFDKVTHFSFAKELEKGNMAVGIVVGGLSIMIGLMIGLIIGMGLN
jgi:putative membrane protein